MLKCIKRKRKKKMEIGKGIKRKFMVAAEAAMHVMELLTQANNYKVLFAAWKHYLPEKPTGSFLRVEVRDTFLLADEHFVDESGATVVTT